MKIISSMLVLLFLVFALVQFNDPDPFLWIAIYLTMAGMAAATFFRRINAYIPLIVLVICGALIINVWPGTLQWMNSADRRLIFDDIAKMQNIYIEEAREFFGLLISVVACLYFFLINRKAQPQD